MTLRQCETPLLSAMRRYVAAGVLPFYTPGHKMGQGMETMLRDILGRAAQQLAAELYGADQSFFTINGTTCAIQAMILAVAGPGEKLLIPRNAHRSVIGGLILSGAAPVFLPPAVDEELGVAMGVPPEAVERALEQHPDAKGVLLVNPTYYGVSTDLAAVAALVHRRNLPLLVDEAHGPHLCFSDELPLAALDAGADAVAQSTHKILGALTQASMLHYRAGRISLSRLKAMLRLVQSTSPNYLLLASLDVARMQMATQGRELVGKSIELAGWVRREVNAIPGLYCFGEEKTGVPGVHALDPTKVTVSVRGLGLTGREAEEILRYRYKIQAELSDRDNVLFLITLGDAEAEVRQLVAALRDLAMAGQETPGPERRKPMPLLPLPELAMTPRDAAFSRAVRLPFASAAGRVCAETVTFYPPGIPVLCPGEKITREIIEHCRYLQEAGLYVSGPEDAALQTLKVVD